MLTRDKKSDVDSPQLVRKPVSDLVVTRQLSIACRWLDYTGHVRRSIRRNRSDQQ